MKILVTKTFNEHIWKDIILQLNGNPFHLPQILDAEVNRNRTSYLIIKDKDKIVAACPVLIKKSFSYRKFSSCKTMQMNTFPATNFTDISSLNIILDSLKEYSIENKIDEISIGARWGVNYEGAPAQPITVGRRLLEFIVNLQEEYNDSKYKIKKKHRKNIRKAQEADVCIEISNNLRSFLKLRELQKLSSNRAKKRSNPYSIRGRKSYARLFNLVYSNNCGNIILAKRHNKIIAALTYITFGKKAVTTRSGSSAEGYEYGATYLLNSFLIEHLRENGFSELNMGGVPEDASNPSHPQHGLYNFKKDFGGQPILRTSFEIKGHFND